MEPTAGTRELRARLDAARVPVRPKSVDFSDLDGFPTPVRRYFRAVLEDGQPMVAWVLVRHTGTFNMGETRDLWKHFASDQSVVTKQPGFDWNERVAMMPGLPVRVHDACVAGEGILHASVIRYVPTPWQGRFWNYEERGGMRVPLYGEVAWMLPERANLTGVVISPRSPTSSRSDSKGSLAVGNGPSSVPHDARRLRPSITLPALAPRCTPDAIVRVPFTRTCEMPSGKRLGSW